MSEHPALKNLYKQVVSGVFNWERWGLLSVLSDYVLYFTEGDILELLASVLTLRGYDVVSINHAIAVDVGPTDWDLPGVVAVQVSLQPERIENVEVPTTIEVESNAPRRGRASWWKELKERQTQ